MRKLAAFTQLTLNGFFADAKSDMSWAHRRDVDDEEWAAFAAENTSSGGTLLFGRITYELMVSYWPTPQAMKDAPIVAEAMNSLPKVVFSRSLANTSWNNTKIVEHEIEAAVKDLKKESGKDIVILGSGSIVKQLAQTGLIDEYQIVINPIALGQGKTLFAGIEKMLKLKRTKTRAFDNGNVLLCYESG